MCRNEPEIVGIVEQKAAVGEFNFEIPGQATIYFGVLFNFSGYYYPGVFVLQAELMAEIEQVVVKIVGTRHLKKVVKLQPASLL